jgi:hypothetical protein
MRETYGELWDHYVASAFPRLQDESGGELTYPGEEWGSETSWNAIFDRLFVPGGVKDWRYAIEIGGGGGKYTERVLDANDRVKIWGFDVSRNFLDATAERLSQHVDAKRLILNEIDSVHPDAMLQLFEKEGLARKIDAMFSIDAMVHVDLQYLVTYWINAALVLKQGGRIVMTLADPTSEAGFQKLIRDIKKFYRYQGRICPKFEYLDKQIVSHVLQNLGFDIEYLEQWSPRGGSTPARDLYLVARLERLEQAENFRAAITTGLPLAPLSTSGFTPPQSKSVRPSGDRGKPAPGPASRPVSRPVSGPVSKPVSKSVSGGITEVQRESAQAIGKAYWRALTLQSNPDITKEQLREQLKHSWGGSRREYARLGMVVLRQLESLGYRISKDSEPERAGSPAKPSVRPAGRTDG